MIDKISRDDIFTAKLYYLTAEKQSSSSDVINFVIPLENLTNKTLPKGFLDESGVALEKKKIEARLKNQREKAQKEKLENLEKKRIEKAKHAALLKELKTMPPKSGVIAYCNYSLKSSQDIAECRDQLNVYLNKMKTLTPCDVERHSPYYNSISMSSLLLAFPPNSTEKPKILLGLALFIGSEFNCPVDDVLKVWTDQ